MMKKSAIAATLLLAFLCTGTAFAQTSGPQPAAAAKATSADKQAISKSCSDQADAKGLHGKERRTFRSECKRAGGKPR